MLTSLECASSASLPTLHFYILRLRATLAGPVQLVRHYYTRVMRASLSTSLDLKRARSYSTPRRSACVVAPTIGRHVLLSTSSGHFNLLRFFGHRSYFFTSTPVVSGGASVDSDRPLPGDTTRCLLFHRYRGGITPG